MLVELVVENYAVIERARVRFHRGLNLLTGETGSGKSIVVDALGLLLGGRAAAELVRSGADRTRVSGIFEVPSDKRFRALLDEAGVEAEDGELLLEREIQAGGKSRAFAGSRPVTAALLRDLAPFLADIHGQHDQQQLFSARAQLDLLDAFASADDLLGDTARFYGEWRTTASELEDLDRSEQEKLRMADLWSFQRNEIAAAVLRPDEDTELENERRVLRNIARLQELAGAAYAALYDAPESALAAARVAARRIDELYRIDPSLGELPQALKNAEIALDEVAYGLRDYLGRLEADPARLDEVESRLALIDKLRRKYGGTIAEMLGFLAEVSAKLEALETAGERRAELKRKLERLEEEYRAAAGRLSAKRQEAARKLERRVEGELASLAMERTVFRIAISPAEWSGHGADSVEFLVSPNAGEEPRALDKVASGGELSRIALALKTCITGKAKAGVPLTLVFDEVDAGIGGAAAETVGRRLKQLGEANQVLCVTHLAQIAGFADHHYAIEKREVKGRTVAEVEELTGEARTREIGRMLSGQRLTPEALKHAERLIRSSR